ncbi:hypothetical protein FNV43_RR15126 [Rhamnella rubrinervis]|uniref:NDH-dependent cyclic electron flow 5 n=1 Tax=Rhamnella rubrinervis TaxID=2594499 RepID=A0A8K0E768_9ROSA|nr:hypothetical protein FNV43_RR15126 [Rhamnella rubrinervis]
MGCNSALSPNLLPFASTSRISIKPGKCPNLASSTVCFHNNQSNGKREEKLMVAAVASIPFPQPENVDVDYLEKEFGGHGVTFEGIGHSCVAKISLENRSTAILMLPTGLITSYKPCMWHGGTDEFLHSVVSEDDAAIQGGVSLAFNFANEDATNEVSWSPTKWALQDIKRSSQDSIQVQLICTDAEDMVEVKYNVTLEEDALSSELVISNSKSSPIRLTGSVLSHLTLSSPDATFAIGLEGSDFLGLSPFLSNFSIIPPDFAQNNEFGFSQLWNQMSLWGTRNGNKVDEAKSNVKETQLQMEGEENDNYKHLRDQMSRIYTSAPRNFTLIDRGRRNSVAIGRHGFDELYMFSPGSIHEIYSQYAYICVGQSALLKPIIIGSKEVWRGGQHLHNPNL